MRFDCSIFKTSGLRCELPTETMWRFLPGVAAPPPAKKPKEDKQKYEIKRERKFLEKWKTRKDGTPRQWLVYDEDKDHMVCSYCKTYSSDKTTEFVRG